MVIRGAEYLPDNIKNQLDEIRRWAEQNAIIEEGRLVTEEKEEHLCKYLSLKKRPILLVYIDKNVEGQFVYSEYLFAPIRELIKAKKKVSLLGWQITSPLDKSDNLHNRVLFYFRHPNLTEQYISASTGRIVYQKFLEAFWRLSEYYGGKEYTREHSIRLSDGSIGKTLENVKDITVSGEIRARFLKTDTHHDVEITLYPKRVTTEDHRTKKLLESWKSSPALSDHATHLCVEKPLLTQEHYREFIQPYRNLLEKHDIVKEVEEILKLLAKYGECPSIVDTEKEAKELASLKHILKVVNLQTHTIKVTKIALNLLKETYGEKDYVYLIPKMLIAALGHDLGKTPALRNNNLPEDHATISAARLNKIFKSNPNWLPSLLNTVRNHHDSSNDTMTTLLRKADGKAREEEVMELSDIKAMKWEEWFDVEGILKRIRPKINILIKGPKWEAFSFNSVVYCQPSFLCEATRRLAREKRVIDISILRASDKEVVLKRIVDSLRKKGVVSDELKEGYYGRLFEVRGAKMKHRFYLTPLKIEAFGVLPHEIEKKKKGYLQIITRVVPQ